jgi:hypothetical protein
MQVEMAAKRKGAWLNESPIGGTFFEWRLPSSIPFPKKFEGIHCLIATFHGS